MNYNNFNQYNTLENYLQSHIIYNDISYAHFGISSTRLPKELQFEHINIGFFYELLKGHKRKDYILNLPVTDQIQIPGYINIENHGFKYIDFLCIGNEGLLSNGNAYFIQRESGGYFYLKIIPKKDKRKVYFSHRYPKRFDCLQQINKMEYDNLYNFRNYDTLRDITITNSELYRLVERIFYENGAIDRCLNFVEPEEFVYNLYEIEDNKFEGELNNRKFILDLTSSTNASINDLPIPERLYEIIIDFIKEKYDV